MATPYEARLIELIARLQGVLDELEAHVRQGPDPEVLREQEIRAFADEALRDRDA